MSTLQEEISRRRTFAIISHPDAGKTTLTEKFLLYGGAIAQAGAGQGQEERPGRHLRLDGDRKAARHLRHLLRHAVPVRGLLHQHPGHPGPPGLLRGHLPHPDGRRLRRHGHRRQPRAWRPRPASCSRSAPCGTSPSSPSSTRWTGRPGTPSSCCEELEKELGIDTYAVNWPIGCGKEFQGVYDRENRQIIHFTSDGQRQGGHRHRGRSWTIPAWTGSSAQRASTTSSRDEVELLDGAGRRVRHGPGAPRQALPGVLRLRPHQLRRGALPGGLSAA